VRERTVSWEDPAITAARAREVNGIELIQDMADGKLPGPPIANLLGMTVEKVAEGQVTFGLEVGEHQYNPIGSVHGGVFATLLDSVMGCAVHTTLRKGQGYTTLELKVNLIKRLTIDTPKVTATGRVLSAGRRVATAEGQITGPDGTLFAHATTTCLIFEEA
jgi:uncharacterized protein (TIGR00369 family)